MVKRREDREERARGEGQQSEKRSKKRKEKLYKTERDEHREKEDPLKTGISIQARTDQDINRKSSMTKTKKKTASDCEMRLCIQCDWR